MAEIRKLSVGKLLDKLRSTDAPKELKIMRLDEKSNYKTLDQRLRAARRRLEQDQRAGSTGGD
jgi:hypothetical protein